MSKAATKKRVAELYNAIVQGDAERVRRLLRDGAPPNSHNDQGRTMLSVAAVNSDRACVEALLEAGADPNLPNSNGRTLFRDVTGLTLARILFDAGMDMNAPSADGLVPLDHCVRTKALGMVRLLLERGAEIPAHMREAAYWDSLGKGAVPSQRVIFSRLTTGTIQGAMSEPSQASDPDRSDPSPL